MIEALRLILGLVLHLSVADKPLGGAIAYFIGAASVSALPLLIAGFRLMRGRGRLSGSIVIALMAFDVLLFGAPPAATYFAIPYNEVIGIITRCVLFLVILNGVRAAFALHHSPRIAETAQSE